MIFLDYASGISLNKNVIKIYSNPKLFLKYIIYGNINKKNDQKSRKKTRSVQFLPNPNAFYKIAKKSSFLLKQAENHILKILNAKNLIWTSGGTNGNYLAIKLLYKNSFENNEYLNNKEKKYLLCGATEHSSVYNSIKSVFANQIKKNELQVIEIPVDSCGVANIDFIETFLSENAKETVGIVLMHGNNEIGTINPVEKIYKITQKFQVPLFTDAIATAGKLNTDINKMGDLVTINSFKNGGPVNTGALFLSSHIIEKFNIPKNQSLQNFINPQTLDTRSITAFVFAISKRLSVLKKYQRKMKKLDSILVNSLRKYGVLINSPQSNNIKKIPGIINFSINKQNIQSDILVSYLSEKNIFVSAGAACNAGVIQNSQVLEKCGLNRQNSIRISFGMKSKKSNIKTLIKTLKNGKFL